MNKPINPTPASDLAIPSDGINNSKLVILSQLPTEGTLIGPQQGNHSEGRATVCGQSDEDKSMDRKDLDNANKSSHHHHHHPQHDASKDFHDYNAKPLPDPKYGSSGSSSLSAEDDSPDNDSTGDDGTGIENPPAAKRRKTEKEDDGGATDQPNVATVQPTAMVEANSAGTADMTAVSDLKPIMNSQPVDVATTSASVTAALPPNVAKKGGISHNVRPVSMGNGAARLQVVPIVKLPPFTGLGKKRVAVPNPVTSAPTEEEPLKQGPVVNATALPITTSVTIFSQPIASATTTDSFSDNPVTASLPISQPQLQEPATAIVTDNETASSSNEECNLVTQIHGHYHVNEDDRVLMEDVLMCPFMFRSRDAIHCGSVSECVMPGMLRAQFSARNKLQSVELLYDAMGLMQQLARASGQEGTAQIVPGSVEMALTPTTTEARVITMAEPPYLIMNVNEVWTRTTGYTQMDVEGKEYLSLLEGEETVVEAKLRPGKPWHLLEEVAKGRPACSTNIHCRKDGQGFVEFVCSYPLTNESDEITHILHVSKELPSSLSTSNHR